MIDYTKVSNLEFEDIDHNDYPDFCDAYCSYAEIDGIAMNEKQLEELNENRDFVYDKLIDYLY